MAVLWVYGRYKYVNSFSAGTVFRRQILTSKDGPRADRFGIASVCILNALSSLCEWFG